jgi:hypothetical protein
MSMTELETPRARTHVAPAAAHARCAGAVARLPAQPRRMLLIPRYYSRITPIQAVHLWEKTTGKKMSVIVQQDGTAYLGQPSARAPDWLQGIFIDNLDATIDAISEDRGRLVVQPGGGVGHIIQCHRSPWDEKIEAAIAAAETGRRAARLRAEGKLTPATLPPMWRYLLMLGETVAGTADEWRFDRMRRQRRQLAAAIARHKPKSLADLQIKLDFISTHFDPGAVSLARIAVETASAGLKSFAKKPMSTHLEELRHAA